MNTTPAVESCGILNVYCCAEKGGVIISMVVSIELGTADATHCCWDEGIGQVEIVDTFPWAPSVALRPAHGHISTYKQLALRDTQGIRNCVDVDGWGGIHGDGDLLSQNKP